VDGISPAAIARDLCITVAELNRHVFGLIPTAIDGGAALTPPTPPKLTLHISPDAAQQEGRRSHR
jgi:hypothetical protein